MTADGHKPSPAAPGDPPAVERCLERTIHFYEVDAMGVMWFGNYCRLMDEAGAHLRRLCGLSYEDFKQERIMAPVKRMEVDYKLPLVLDERVKIVARMPWSEAVRLDTEFTIYKQDGRVAATAWMVQLLVEADGMRPIYVDTPFIQRVRERWRRGEFVEHP